MNAINRLACATVVVLVATSVSGAEIIKEFRGSNSTTTAEFRVDGPWLLDWRLDSDFSNLVALDITLVEAKTGRHLGRILHTKRKGNGLKLFNDGGVYQLRISSTLGRWTIKIQQITAEEAPLYTPRRNN
jgi:hypothetical protein